MPVHASARRSTALLLVLGVAACGTSHDASTIDSTGASAVAAPRVDSAAAGGGGTAMSESAPKDSNQAFLRMMVDHHEGLVAMATAAQGKLQGATPKSDAQKLVEKQTAEQQQMKTMLSSAYGDQHMAMVPPSNKAMNDSLQATGPGPDYDKDFYHHVIAHHREGVQMIDKMLPHLTGDVKSMAEKGKADQQQEITEFEKKGGAGGPKG